MNRRKVIKTMLPLSAAGLMNFKINASGFCNQPIKPDYVEVVNAGIGGNNTFDILERLQTDCLSHHPDLVILMIGTNDVNSLKSVPFEKYEQNLKEIVKKIGAVKSKVLLLSILPFYEPYLLTRHKKEFYEPEGPNGRKDILNKIVYKISKQCNLYFIDLGYRFTTIGKIGTDMDSLIRNECNGSMQDGVHPTPNGYRFMALTVYDYLKFKNIIAKKIVCLGDSITLGASAYENYPKYLSMLLNAE